MEEVLVMNRFRNEPRRRRGFEFGRMRGLCWSSVDQSADEELDGGWWRRKSFQACGILVANLNRNHFITLGYRESPLAMLSFSMVRYHTDSTGINYISHLIPPGYRYSFPFLPQCIDTSRCTNGTVPIQGTKVQSTRRQQIYYTEEPTIGFIDMNTGIETLLYSEFTSVALSKVSSGQARLSSSDSMREMHEEHVGKGY
ncbi:hypothetical protein F5879DRAFT_434709 [Lentinula edodes]|nr:hypothetical protein F5879DRAFT_434709 [Lentinula edodes]